MDENNFAFENGFDTIGILSDANEQSISTSTVVQTGPPKQKRARRTVPLWDLELFEVTDSNVFCKVKGCKVKFGLPASTSVCKKNTCWLIKTKTNSTKQHIQKFWSLIKNPLSLKQKQL